jgi:uncharacterized protein YjaG (DUF416 family)
MELIITLIVLIIIWCVAFMVGNKQGTNQLINQIKKDGGYYDMEYTSSVYPILDPTSSLNEVPKEFLMGGDIERTLHIAGVKQATPAKLQEWQDERFNRASIETEQRKTIDDLLSTLDKADLQLKAGIVSPETTELLNKTKEHAEKIKISIKEIDPIEELKMKTDAARKQHERERQERIKIDFDALNFSRISNEARKQITEIVKQDLENKIKQIEKNTPEINENDTMGSIGSKPKTQTDYQREHKVEQEKGDIDFMHKWIQEKSGKKDPIPKKENPKQFNGIKTEEPFVKTRTKRKPKTTKEWEDEFDIGGNS